MSQYFIADSSATKGAYVTIAVTMVNQLPIAAAHLAVHIVWEQSVYCWIMFQVRFFFPFFIARRIVAISCIAVIIVRDTSFLYMA